MLDLVIFMRHVVSVNCILVYLSKVKVMLEWQRPMTTKKVWNFLGLVRYYRQFIERFTKLDKLLIELTKSNVPFRWLDAYKRSFQKLKRD